MQERCVAVLRCSGAQDIRRAVTGALKTLVVDPDWTRSSTRERKRERARGSGTHRSQVVI